MNIGPTALQADALPTELCRPVTCLHKKFKADLSAIWSYLEADYVCSFHVHKSYSKCINVNNNCDITEVFIIHSICFVYYTLNNLEETKQHNYVSDEKKKNRRKDIK